MSEKPEEELVFSLTCLHCDAGMDVDSEQAAIEAGWSDLAPDPNGLAWTWVGFCPSCQQAGSEF